MTRKEFAEKYKVDYQMVVEASKLVRVAREKNAQFDEGCLGEAVCQELAYRVGSLERRLAPLKSDYERLNMIRWT